MVSDIPLHIFNGHFNANYGGIFVLFYF